MKNEQSAVDWLIDMHKDSNNTITPNMYKEAKEMEKYNHELIFKKAYNQAIFDLKRMIEFHALQLFKNE